MAETGDIAMSAKKKIKLRFKIDCCGTSDALDQILDQVSDGAIARAIQREVIKTFGEYDEYIYVEYNTKTKTMEVLKRRN